MKVYTWHVATPRSHRFIMVAADSVAEARLKAQVEVLAKPSRAVMDASPGGELFAVLMGPPDFVDESLDA